MEKMTGPERIRHSNHESARSSGELPWRTNLGAGLGLLRHRANDAVLRELARVYVRDALKRWVPGARLVGLVALRDGWHATCHALRHDEP